MTRFQLQRAKELESELERLVEVEQWMASVPIEDLIASSELPMQMNKLNSDSREILSEILRDAAASLYLFMEKEFDEL